MDMQNIESQLEELKSQVEAISKKSAENKLAMVVFSGDLGREGIPIIRDPQVLENADILTILGTQVGKDHHILRGVFQPHKRRGF